MLSRVETLLMINHLKHWGLIVMDNLFPRFCIACQRRLLLNERYICIDCLCDMPFTHFNGEKGNIIERITCDDVVSTERANSLLFYRSQSKFCHIYFHFKYHNHPEVAVEMGRMMANELKDTDFFNGIDCMVPVPLSTQRFKKRGYNQSERLAFGISEVTGIPIDTTSVIRSVDNPTQTNLNVQQRRDNVKNIFELVNAQALHGKHVLIVDDVITTGSTTRACAHAAAAAGDVTISIISLGTSSYNKKRKFASEQRP